MSLFEKPAPVGGEFANSGLQTAESDPALAFMLAQQAITRWRFEIERLGAAADTAQSGANAAAEAQPALQQVRALAERIRPFENFIDIAVRFEAQEVLAAIEALEAELEQIVRLNEPEAPWRDAESVLEQLVSRRQ